MSDSQQAPTPESSAVRVALWRALHLEVDAKPSVLEDDIGLKLVAPDEDWRRRPDMDPQGTRLYRAAILARARFIDDLVAEQIGRGVRQYVILGAGLDSFAQRRPELAARLTLFEVDQPGPQAWKRQRLNELGFGVPDWLRFVPVDFESDRALWERLAGSGFDARKPAVIASTGVSLYLTKEAVAASLRESATLAPGSTVAMTYILPLEMADPTERPGHEAAQQGAKASGTPFRSFFTQAEMLSLARDAGFKQARCVAAATLAQRYFSGRSDGLAPGSGEEFLLAAT